MMKKTTAVFLLALGLGVLGLTQARAHCQIPCGIYDDPARFTEMLEHITTIEKSMTQINTLSSEAPEQNVNQLVRWVMNKEDHVDELTEIVTFYFMAQRVKPAEAGDAAAYRKYVGEVTLLHRMVVVGMKCKQTTDLDQVKALRDLVGAFKKSYLGE
jgi:nickel superoxide dismutase